MVLLHLFRCNRNMGRGRPRVTESAKKRRRQAGSERRNRARITVGKHTDRWNAVRESIGYTTEEFILHLLEVHDNKCGCDKHSKDVPVQVNAVFTPARSRSPNFTTPPTADILTPQPQSGSTDSETSDTPNFSELPFNVSLSSLAASLPASPPSSPSQQSLIHVAEEEVFDPDTRHSQEVQGNAVLTPARSQSPNFTTPPTADILTPQPQSGSTDSETSDTPNFNVSLSSLAASLPASPPSSPSHQSLIHVAEEEVFDPDLSDTRATIGEVSSERSGLEEDLLELPEDIPSDTNSLEDLISAPKFIAFLGPVMELVKTTAGSSCRRRSCDKPLTFNHTIFGTALFIKWTCTDGHACGSWCSQPRVKKMFAGNLQLASNILFSGNSYQKVALLFKFCNLGCVEEASFYRVQKLYAAPAVERLWTDMQTRLLLEKSRQGKPVYLAGDGRNDSPGFNAQYCTYVFLDVETNAVLHLEVVDVRQATSSVVMEKMGFVKGLNFLQSKVDVAEIVTDQNKSIIKLMKENPAYKGIVHQFDIWHEARNLEKRLLAACPPKSELRQWSGPIKNHFWWSSQVCDGNTLKMKETWVRVLKHVANEHEWVVAGHTEGGCSHGPLNQDDHELPWLEKKSEDMDVLRAVVTDPRFLVKFPYFRNFRHTGPIEGFNSHLLMYAPKRHSYRYRGYCTRNQLAALDHNHHLQRPKKVDENGDTVYEGNYSKRSKRWRPKVVKQDKNYSYVKDLQSLTFQLKNEDGGKGGLKRKAPVDPDDPTLISSTIAKRPRPPMKDLIKDCISRFEK